ncbi:MAG: hypothetical protein LAQ69_05640 [Acidobacteriia bacterium]|nr:hypothetical protein [Terriglobia bacterium]
MKVRWIAAAAPAVYLMFAGSGLAQDSVIGTIATFNGSEIADPATYIPERGMIRCVGMDNPPPTSDAKSPPWCPNGTQTSARARVMLLKWETADPNISGTIRYNFSFDLDSATWNGPWWGNFALEVPGKGAWVGWLVGETAGRPAIGGKSVHRMFAVGEGQFQGCHLMAEVVWGLTPGKGNVTGRYLLPSQGSASLPTLPSMLETLPGLRINSGFPGMVLR